MLNQNTFKEVTNTASSDFISAISYGAGAWADFNGDNYPDLWVGNHFGPVENSYNRNLFLNNKDGTFTDIVSDVFIPEELKGDYHGAAWADFDNDGDQDLIVAAGGEKAGTNLPPDSDPNRLYINEGGVLRDNARELGLAYDSAKAHAPIWWDFNNDGKLDLFHGSTKRPDRRNPTTLFQQTNTGFEDVGESLLPGHLRGASAKFGALANLSDDHSPALVLPASVRTILDADAGFSFTRPGILNGARDLAVADFNGDLMMDIYLVRRKEDRLAINTGEGLSDRSQSAGINLVSNALGESVVAEDFDNDMDVDVYVVRASDGTSNLPNVLYENQGDGTFTAVEAAGGAFGTTLGDGDSATTADYDLDGFIDLFVTNGSGGNPASQQLFRNQGNGNNWLQIDLEGTASNRDGIGAQVYVTSGGVTQRRDQMGGIHKWSQNYKRLHFGLGQNTQIDKIEIRWPSGLVQELENISVNQIIQISETGSVVENASPVARDDSATTLQNTPVDIDVLANDTDADGDPLTLSIAEAPNNGTVSVNDNNTDTDPSDDFVTYTPNTGFSGTDQFVYRINDSSETDVATVTVTVDDVQSNQPDFLLAFTNAATLSGIRVEDEDIVLYDGDNFSLFFDGSDVGLCTPKLRIAAFDAISDTEILMSFNQEVSIEGIGLVDDSDVVKFTATSLGQSTAGTFEMYLDGSDVGLVRGWEDIDALTQLPDGSLLISTIGRNTVPEFRGSSEDLLLFSPSSLGETTSGSWSLYFDGSDVGLEDRLTEDLDAVSLDATGRLLLSTQRDFVTPDIEGANEDVFVFLGNSTGANTSGSFEPELLFDGSSFGLSYNNIAGIDSFVG